MRTPWPASHRGARPGALPASLVAALVLLLGPAIACPGQSPRNPLRPAGTPRPPRKTSDANAPAQGPAPSVADLAARARASLVVLSAKGRDGVGESVGTGFVIDPSGLVATSLHVVGEGRPVSARLVSGRELEIEAMHAFDRHTDLAILRVRGTNLPALPLAQPGTLAVGAEIVALGNPMGLVDSVVSGVLSGRRTMDGVDLMQLAIPIEPGNSGGPVIDREGRVHGIVNAKSLLTRNLGFATPVELLLPLLGSPNPVPYARWTRTGLLDPSAWEPRLGARWRQKSGRILVEGAGSGFGGRTFAMHRQPMPEGPAEVSVQVRLDDESGAAGLVFGGDDGGLHLGFYPTAGQLRLTSFEGEDIFTWRILGTLPSAAYRPGEWNHLRVRTEPGRVTCLVNGSVVFDLRDVPFHGRRVGLAKFRSAGAEFRGFHVGPASAEGGTGLAPALVMALGGADLPIARVDQPEREALRAQLPAARSFLAQRARQLESEAARLRSLSSGLHREQVAADLAAALRGPDDGIDLARAALLVARHDEPEVDVAAAQAQLEALAAEVSGRFKPGATDAERVDVLREFLFAENGFHGSRHDYQNRANSHLHSVLDDREGLPITLAIVFMDVARRAGIRGVVGWPLPGHFLVAHEPREGTRRLIDVFHGGRLLTHSEASELGSESAGVPVRADLMNAATPREIVVRLINNLLSFSERQDGPAASLPYADLLVAIAADARDQAGHRVERARLRAQSGDLEGAREDLRWILEAKPEGTDLEGVSGLLRRLETAR